MLACIMLVLLVLLLLLVVVVGQHTHLLLLLVVVPTMVKNPHMQVPSVHQKHQGEMNNTAQRPMQEQQMTTRIRTPPIRATHDCVILLNDKRGSICNCYRVTIQ